MKKFLFVGALVACFHASAQFMMWTIDSDVDDIPDAVLDAAEYMQVGYVTQNGNNPSSGTILNQTSLYGGISQGKTLQFEEGAGYKVDLTGLDANGGKYSFYIEILNDQNQVIARTGNNKTYTYTTYNQLDSGNYICTGDIGTASPVNIWHGSFEAVPEPSSMALLALGAGLVGLRRKLKKGKKEKRA